MSGLGAAIPPRLAFKQQQRRSKRLESMFQAQTTQQDDCEWAGACQIAPTTSTGSWGNRGSKHILFASDDSSDKGLAGTASADLDSGLAPWTLEPRSEPSTSRKRLWDGNTLDHIGQEREIVLTFIEKCEKNKRKRQSKAPTPSRSTKREGRLGRATL